MMKNLMKKTNMTVLLIVSMSLALIGCGTGADSAGMSSQPSQSFSILKWGWVDQSWKIEIDLLGLEQ